MWDFEQRYLAQDAESRLTGYQNLAEIRQRLAPIMLRRRKEEVLRELPPRVDKNLFVGMTPQQFEPHESYKKTIAEILQKKILTDIDYQRILICLTCMRMLCHSTWILDLETNFATKLEELRQLVPEVVEAMAIAGGANIPLARGVIGGILASTVLTLSAPMAPPGLAFLSGRLTTGSASS